MKLFGGEVLLTVEDFKFLDDPDGDGDGVLPERIEFESAEMIDELTISVRFVTASDPEGEEE